jgi:hypothetical protein
VGVCGCVCVCDKWKVQYKGGMINDWLKETDRCRGYNSECTCEKPGSKG